MNTLACALIGAVLTILVVGVVEAVLPDQQSGTIIAAGIGGALASYVGFYFGRGRRPLP